MTETPKELIQEVDRGRSLRAISPRVEPLRDQSGGCHRIKGVPQA